MSELETIFNMGKYIRVASTKIGETVMSGYMGRVMGPFERYKILDERATARSVAEHFVPKPVCDYLEINERLGSQD